MKNYFNIKMMTYRFPLWIMVIACLCACKKSDGDRDPRSTDTTKPGIVSNVRVKNLNGSAVLTYDLPSSENLLYVMAEYKINGTTIRQTKSSYFLDTLKVDGFQKSQEYTVTLKAVTRANVQSDPVTVTVHPDTPYYQLIRKSMVLSADFGGINIKADNRYLRSVGMNLITIDPSSRKFEIKDQKYFSGNNISYAVRGFPSTEARFGVFVTDQFGNVSDTALVNLTPLYEELLDKSKFSTYMSVSDAYIGYGGIAPYLWDGITKEGPGAQPWQTTIGPVHKRMQTTFSVGRTYKLSHFVLWSRGYGYDNPKSFTIWGSNKTNPQDADTPGGAAPGTISGDWTAMGNFRFPDPPSGLPQGQTNAADQAFVNAGVSFDVPFSSPAAKYLRVVVHETWFGLDYTNILELSFYGIPQ